MGVDVQPFLLPDNAGGHRFGLLVAPNGAEPQALVLHSQALGHEMNLARRQVSLTARAWARAGAAVLILDLAGCGDSNGDTHSAPWRTWDADLQRAAAWLRGRWPGVPLWGWGLRGGSLAMANAWPEGGGPDHWLFWAGLLDGSDLHSHWQRQALAAALAEGGDGRAAVQSLQQAWAQGQAMDVGGSVISADLAQGAHARSLVGWAPLPPGATAQLPARVVWIDVHAAPRSSPGPRLAAWLADCAARGWQTAWHTVEGPPFWLGPEVATLPDLTATTLQAVGSAGVAA